VKALASSTRKQSRWSQKVKGTVYAIEGGLAFAKTDGGRICWFEPLCGEVEVEDVVSGDLCARGRQLLHNETNDRSVGVLVEGCSEALQTSARLRQRFRVKR
jgi:hypothetical protein